MSKHPKPYQAWRMLPGFAACALAALWYWGWNITVLDYGPIGKTYFVPPQAKAEEIIKLCFDSVKWLQLCPTELEWNVTCNVDKMGSRRLDFPAYKVNVPAKAGPVPPKCRDFTVPKSCKPGKMTYSAVARSVCAPFWEWNPRYVEVPQVELEVIPSLP